jgi:hypothetical protein
MQKHLFVGKIVDDALGFCATAVAKSYALTAGKSQDLDVGGIFAVQYRFVAGEKVCGDKKSGQNTFLL